MKKIISLGIILVFSLIVANKNSFAVKMPARTNSAVNVHSAKFQYSKALEAMRGGYYYNSVQHFQKAIIIKPHFALAWAHMGVALHKLGFPSLAIVSIKKALKYQPNMKWAQTVLKKYIASPRR
jgi:Tfp pilus assembly protein PilF